jgi:hypothetical protein
MHFSDILVLCGAYFVRHQGTALDFMKQRENGPIPPGYRLWELTEEAGVSWYVIRQVRE